MSSHYRSDVDGLRAVSILLVVMFHAFPALLPGGYLGVDVFFVISGFLITDLMLRRAAQGFSSLGEFYARRVRRLFPALLAVTVACLVFGWFALLPGEYAQLGRHALAASVFVPNVAFWSEAGYWDTASRLKPLLHLWSLGVEEQFYLVWPALVLLLGRTRLPFPAWVLPVAAISFAANLYAANADPAAAFFLPQFRIWELMLGGLLAHRNFSPAAQQPSSPPAQSTFRPAQVPTWTGCRTGRVCWRARSRSRAWR
ncbi:MAG: acyltransferase family protein [Candidatus Binatia bacterium]